MPRSWAAATPTAPIEESPSARAAATAVFLPDQRTGFTAGAVVLSRTVVSSGVDTFGGVAALSEAAASDQSTELLGVVSSVVMTVTVPADPVANLW